MSNLARAVELVEKAAEADAAASSQRRRSMDPH